MPGERFTACGRRKKKVSDDHSRCSSHEDLEFIETQPKWLLTGRKRSARVCLFCLKKILPIFLKVIDFVAAATTAVGDSPAKKSKNVKTKATEAAKDDPPKSILKKNANGVASKETKADLPLKLNGEPTRQIKPRKRAADFHSDEENDEPAAPTQTESSKKSGSKKAKAEETIAKPAGKKAAAKGKKIEEVAEESEEEDADGIFSASEESEQDVEEDNEDDQTAALIKGFESSGDEAESEDEGYNPDQPVPRIPDSKKTKRKILKKQKKTDEAEAPGTVYVG